MKILKYTCFLLILSMCLAGMCLAQETKEEIDKKEEKRAVEEGMQKKKVGFSGQYKLYYDSNPEFVSTGEEEDWVHALQLTARAKFVESGPHEAGGQYTLSGDWHTDVDEKDILGHVVDLHYGRDLDKSNFRFDYIFSHYSQDTEEYLQKHTFAPMFFYGSSGRTLEMVRLAASVNEYPDLSGFDGTDWSLQVRHFHFLDAQKQKRVSISYKFAKNDADDDNNSYDSHRIKGDLKFPLVAKFTGVVELSFTAKEFGGGRDDEKVEYGLEFTRPINDYWKISFGHSGTDNQSDAANSDYERSVTFVAATASF
jgi:hypothetical protein